jgi:fatty-acid desaturase
LSTTIIVKARHEAKDVVKAKDLVKEKEDDVVHQILQHQEPLVKFVPSQIMILLFVGIGMVLILTYQVKVVVSMQDLEYKRA